MINFPHITFPVSAMSPPRRRSSLLCLPLITAVLPATASSPVPDPAAAVAVDITLAAPGVLEVAYHLPAACTALPFIKHGSEGAGLRASWQALDDCGAADGDTLSRKSGACPALRFRVPVTADPVNGYPAAFPVGEGVYVHASNYAVAPQCGAVAYHFSAPGIAVAGGAVQGLASSTRDDAAALLLPAPLPPTPAGGTPFYFDAQLPAATVAQVRTVADGTVAYLKTTMPDAPYLAPAVAVARVSEPGGPNVGGDAADVLRLALYNWPAQPGPAEQAKLTLLVSHEFSHRFQLRDAVDGYPDARLIHEGGAEFLRWLVSVEQGWLTRAQAAEQLDAALADCLLDTDGQGWRGLNGRTVARNRLDYRCGLPVYVYALAARQGSGTAIGRLNDFYRDVGQGRFPDFAHALECGATPGCTPRWLPRLLGAAPMAAQWTTLLAASALARPAPPETAQRDAMVLRALVQLMRDDCRGASSSTQTPDSVLLDAMRSCTTLTRDSEVVRIEGTTVFGDDSTLARLTAACERGHVALGLRDNSVLDLPCRAPYHARTSFPHVDIDRVLGSLLRQ